MSSNEGEVMATQVVERKPLVAKMQEFKSRSSETSYMNRIQTWELVLEAKELWSDCELGNLFNNFYTSNWLNSNYLFNSKKMCHKKASTN